MAEDMRSDVPHWEKSGNINWVQCPICTGWFPVDPKLATSKTIKMICPHCAAQFISTEAAQIV